MYLTHIAIIKGLLLMSGLLFLSACHNNTKPVIQTIEPNNNNLNSTLWLQNSAEFKASALQTYNTAQKLLPVVLADNSVTAALEQTAGFKDLPPAIILDVDETILDNSPYQAQLIKNDKSFELVTWDEWVRLKSAKAIPGAVEFINAALKNNVRIIYVTNRECLQRDSKAVCPQKMDTMINLKNVGISDINMDDLMLKKEQADWTSEKQSRREVVTEDYRVLMLFGDDLGDFLPDVKSNITHQQRAELVQHHQQRWGHTWYVFGNPTYGSWQRVLSGDGKSYLEGYE